MRILPALAAAAIACAAAPAFASSALVAAADSAAIAQRIDAVLQATAADMQARIEARNALAIHGALDARPQRIAAYPVRAATTTRALRW